MERGVYVAEFGGLKEVAAVDQSGRVIRRTVVMVELFTDRDLNEMRVWLERVDPPRHLRLL